MGELQIVTTLRAKRDDIERAIALYEEKIADARRDLAHVTATLRLFELNGEQPQFPVYLETGRLFRRGEMMALAKAALASEGPLDTRELALRLIRAKGLDEGDKVLRQTVTYRLVQALAAQARRGKVGSGGKRKGVRVWATPSAPTP